MYIVINCDRDSPQKQEVSKGLRYVKLINLMTSERGSYLLKRQFENFICYFYRVGYVAGWIRAKLSIGLSRHRDKLFWGRLGYISLPFNRFHTRGFPVVNFASRRLFPLFNISIYVNSKGFIILGVPCENL